MMDFVTRAMNGRIQPVVTDEPVEFEKWPVQIQGIGKSTGPFRRTYRILLNSIKENEKMYLIGVGNTNLGSRLMIPKNLPGHRARAAPSSTVS